MNKRPLLEQLTEVAHEEQKREQDAPVPPDSELFAPPSEEKKAELAEKVRAQLGLAAEAKVVPLARPRSAWLWALAASVLLAALGARFFWAGSELAPLPKYSLSMSAGAMELRGEPVPSDSVPSFAPGTSVDLVLRPATALEGPVAWRGFLVQGERWSAWAPQAELDRSGAIRIAGRASSLFPESPGERTLVIVLARPNEIEEAANAVAAGRRDQAIVLEQKIMITE